MLKPITNTSQMTIFDADFKCVNDPDENNESGSDAERNMDIRRLKVNVLRLCQDLQMKIRIRMICLVHLKMMATVMKNQKNMMKTNREYGCHLSDDSLYHHLHLV